jgi:uncharacterized membrane protein (DUF485 family)
MSTNVMVHDGEPGGHQDPDAIAQRRIRVVLSASALLMVAVMALPILTSFTHVLDGVVGGIGVAYIVGFGEFVLAMAGAVTYCRWVDRLEDSADERERAR